MNLRKLSLLAGIVLAGTVLFVLPSCGPEAPAPSGTVYIRYEGAVTSLNPFVAGPAGYSRYASAMIFQTLGILDPETLELQPLLVKEIPKTRRVDSGPQQGKLAYDFEIMEEAAWDNGSPVTSADMLFTLKLIYHPLLSTGVWRSYFEHLAAVETDADNPRKFTIYLNEYYMLGLESMCQIPIFPAYHYDSLKALDNVTLADLLDPVKAEAIGQQPDQQAFATAFRDPRYSNDPAFVTASGPYKLESLDAERGLTLVRKKNWWGDKAVKKNKYLAAYPEKLVYRVVKPEDAVENMLRTGELDIALNFSAPKFIELQKDSSLSAQYDFETRWQASFSRWLFNARNPKLADKRVRQALCQLVDYDYMVQTVAQGQAERTVGPVVPAKPYYAKDVPLYNFEPEKARALLTEAGWTDTDNDGIVDKVIDGKKVALVLDALYSSGSVTTEMVANSLVESLRKAGVQINLVPTDISTISKQTREANFETALLAAGLYPGLVELHQFYHSASLVPAGDNRSGVVNPELDRLIDAIRSTEDPVRRNADYVKAQAIIHDEAPEAFLFVPQQRYIVSKRFDYVISSNRPGFYEQYFKLKE